MTRNIRFLKLEGEKFGKLLVLSKVEKRGPRGEVYWRCKCDCGNESETRASGLKSGKATSCGCSKGFRKHLMTASGTFKSWESMKQRCLNPKAPDYPNYGGRGIVICKRWQNSFDNFFADMGLRPDETSLDRIDVNGNYEPKNCRWATRSEQQRNKRGSIYYLAKEHGLTTKLLAWRLASGWDLTIALNTPKALRKGK